MGRLAQSSLASPITGNHLSLTFGSLTGMLESGLIEYTAFPEGLKARYQSYTEADLTRLRAAGYTAPFLGVEQGVERYVKWLLAKAGGTATSTSESRP